jgi:hypothetical protein
MTTNQLTKEQAKKMHAALLPTLRYVNRLCERLNVRQFPPTDRLYRAAGKAHDAMIQRVTTLHYLTCDGGVGEPSREQ